MQILTVDDLPSNKEASTLNARLRYLVQIDAPYEEAYILAKEAVQNGIKLDMHSYIYLSTLFKPTIPALLDEVHAEAAKKVEEWRLSYVPDTEAMTQAFEGVKDASHADYLEEIINIILSRNAKLDVVSLNAMFSAFAAIGEPEKAEAAFDALHKKYLIDTPTYDAFRKSRSKMV